MLITVTLPMSPIKIVFSFQSSAVTLQENMKMLLFLSNFNATMNTFVKTPIDLCKYLRRLELGLSKTTVFTQ